MEFKKKTIFFLLLAGLGPVLAGCVSNAPADGTNSGGNNNGAGALQVTVTGTEFAFNPSTINASPDQTVNLTFVNNGAFPHTFTIQSLNIGTGTVQAGQSKTISFTAPATTGTYPVICAVLGHADKGMKANLVVQ